ncbi:MAG TPA: hypothetical protein VFH66_09440 [Mycobacteriales bacterium]|nr:hypothetical protein [Mycobacteriales bacterium]
MSPSAIVERIAEAIAAVPGPVRAAIDGPPWSGLDLASHLPEALLARGRTAYVADVRDFLRPASVRLERGRDDPDGYYEDWIDIGALRREVLEPLDPGGSRRILPTLWDVTRDRATRAAYVDVPADGVVIVVGWFLLGAWLPFELTVHVSLSAGARRRRVPPGDAARALPAWQRYDAEVEPASVADLVVRADDPARPALIDRGSR